MSWLANLSSASDDLLSFLRPKEGGGQATEHHGRQSYGVSKRADETQRTRISEMEEEENKRRPYWQCMLAGGLGGSTGDMLMHSIDTVKTRQQGDPHIPPTYQSLPSAYFKILRQEGLRRGLYSGVTPAFLGSFPGTIVFFGTYEYSKRHLIDAGMNHTLAYLSAGFFADWAACFIYVPSEVLKTRMQMQGRHDNPWFRSGYNYRNMRHAIQTIVRQEGSGAMYSGYKATIFRDLPFSALQFAFYEQERAWAKNYVASKSLSNSDTRLSLGWEIATAVSAGGMAGVLTCPLDVVKTRTQTTFGADSSARAVEKHAPSPIFSALRSIYQTEGVGGLFRGVVPRAIWTSVQSGTMLVLYQILLQHMQGVGSDGVEA